MAVPHLAFKAYPCDPAVTFDPDVIHMDGLPITNVDTCNPDKKVVKDHKAHHLPHVNKSHLDENMPADGALLLATEKTALNETGKA